MLSKKTLDMLEYNGYSVKDKDGQTLFKKDGTDRIGLFLIMFISVVFIVFLFAIQVWAGIGAILLAVFVFRPFVQRIPGSLQLAVDSPNQEIVIQNRSSKVSFQEIRGVFIHSKLVDEYASAFKSTSQEHQVTIGLEAQDGKQISLFKMVSDHAKPSKEMNEVYQYLESTILGKAAS